MLSPCSHSGGNQHFGNLNGLSLRQSATSSSSPWFNDELLFRNLLPWFNSRESYNVTSTICVAPFFSGILSLSYPDTNQIWISVRYDGWNIFPRVIRMVFMWPGKVLSCLAHLAGGHVVIDSFPTRLSIHPWGNCKTYSTSCSWWILPASKVWPLLEDHVNAISKHVCGTPISTRTFEAQC